VVVEGSGSPTMRVTSLSLHALIDAHVARIEEARWAVREVLSVSERTGEVLHRIRGLAVLGFVDLSLDNAEGAKRHLESAADITAATGCVDPGVFRFAPDQIEALIRLGLLAEARTLLRDFEARARSLSRWSALAAAGRCRGLLLAAEGDLDGSLQSLEAAMVAHQRVPIPFERARTLLTLGSTLRRAKRKAAPRASLAEALAVFERLGTRLWADKARAELARVGGRPPAGSDLTPSERRLAELVVEGRPNKEIAAALFVTPKTVETNLSRLYRKLGVRSRTELAHRFTEGR
jgi:DNA-binding CsgD family transcriptional regulator